MKVIGLTGGIASGKSKVASLLASWGAVVIDSDLVAHRVMERGKRVQNKIRLHFGKRVFRDGRIDRILLGRIVFRHPAERKVLEAIVHPQVKRILSRRTKELERKGEPFVFLEIPLLFEVGWQKRMDEVWLVYAPPAQQIVRLHDRDHLEEKEMQRRLAAQLPWEEKLKGATRIIDNSGSWERTANQVHELFLGLSER